MYFSCFWRQAQVSSMATPTVDVMAKPHKAPEVRRHKGLKARRYKAVADCAAKTPFNSQN